MIFLLERQGKAVQILHVFGDHLWEAGERFQPPKRDPPPLCSSQEDLLLLKEGVAATSVSKDSSTEEAVQQTTEVESVFSQLSVTDSVDVQSEELSSAAVGSSADLHLSTNSLDEEANEQEENEENVEGKMNELLHNCVFTAIKVKLKDKELPFPTGTFYRQGALMRRKKLFLLLYQD